jgi:hypothetical protein
VGDRAVDAVAIFGQSFSRYAFCVRVEREVCWSAVTMLSGRSSECHRHLPESLLPSFGGSIVPETCAVPEARCRLKKAGSTAMIEVYLVPLCPSESLISVAAVHCLVARLRSEKRPISTPLESLCHDRQPSRAWPISLRRRTCHGKGQAIRL